MSKVGQATYIQSIGLLWLPICWSLCKRYFYLVRHSLCWSTPPTSPEHPGPRELLPSFRNLPQGSFRSQHPLQAKLCDLLSPRPARVQTYDRRWTVWPSFIGKGWASGQDCQSSCLRAFADQLKPRLHGSQPLRQQRCWLLKYLRQ